MNRIRLSLLLLSLLVLITTDQVSCDTFYIITAPGNFCPEEYLSTSPGQGRNSCLTLSEFVLNDRQQQLLDPETVILKLESGNHTLNSPLLVSSNVTISFTILAVNLSSTTTICCMGGSQLQTSAVENVHIKGIDFVGCLANKFESVTMFTLEDFSFNLATLSLLYVYNASIVRGSFSSNSYVNTTLYAYNSTLLLQRTEFVDNKGNIVGALQVIDSEVVVDRCTFLNNSVQNFRLLPNSYNNCGGAIFASASAIDEIGKKKLTIIGSNFTANEATDRFYASRVNGYVGGAICIIDYRSLVILDSTFEKNRARKNGGAISVLGGYKGIIHIDTSQFIKNSLSNFEPEADGSGALYIDGSDVHVWIDQSEFTRNTGGIKIVAGISVFNCTRSVFTKNNERALYITQQRRSWTTLIAIDQCHFTDNFFPLLNYNAGGGGAVAIQALELFPGDSFTMWFSGSTFSNNYANFSGGAVEVITVGDEAHVSVHVVNSSFVNNICNYSRTHFAGDYGLGGAMNLNVSAFNSSISVTQSIFIDNKSTSPRYFTNLKGGALTLTAKTITINQSVFIHNEANLGGALYINRASELLITESTFLDNVIPGHALSWTMLSAGVVFVDTDTNVTTIKRSVFQNNSAPMCGVIDFNHKEYRGTNVVSISESYFANNRAMENEGGVICINRGPVSISNSTFISNSASENGGALFAYNALLRITGSVFENNTAEMDGGGLYGSGEYNISESFFIDNKAIGNGGAVGFDGGRAKISSSSFIDNYASSGGAFHVSAYTFEIQDVAFYNNMAEIDGEVVTACKSAVVLSNEIESLLYIHSDPQYEDNFCIYYDEQIHEVQLNSTNDSIAISIPYVTNEYLLIVPMSNSSDCHEDDTSVDSCLTLQQFAENGTSQVSLNLEIELTSGNHSLDSDLYIRYKGTVVIIANNATIVCSQHKINFNTINDVYINDVIFVGCEVEVSSVNNFMLSDVKFLSQIRLNNILRLDNIVSAIISTSFFIGRAGCCNYWPSHHIIANNVQQLLVTHCTFLNNWGGCIYSDEVHLTVEHSNFTDNINYPTNNPWGRGGAVTARHFVLLDHIPGGDSVNITNSTFTGNSAGYGGAVYVSGPDTPVWISQSTFTRNRANLYFGGAVDIHTGSSVLIDECTFELNDAHYDGGALYSESMALSIEKSNFTGNTVMFRDGGAVRALNSLSVSHSQFVRNKAASKGGAIYFNASSSVSVSINRSRFAYNVLACRRYAGTRGYITACGDNGAALYFKAAATNSIVFDQCEFMNNTAEDLSIEKQGVYIIGTSDITYIYNTTVMTTTEVDVPVTTIETTVAEKSTTSSPTETTITPNTHPPTVTPDVSVTSISEATTSQARATTISTQTTEFSSQTDVISTLSETTSESTSEEQSSTLATTSLPTVETSTTSIPSNVSTSKSSTVPTVPTSAPVNETITTSTEVPTIISSPSASSTISSSTNLTESTTPVENVTETRNTSSNTPTTLNTPVIYHTNAMTEILYETSTSHESTTSTVPVVTAGKGRQVQKIVIPLVAVVAIVVLIAALVSLVVLVLYCFARGHNKRSGDIPSNSNSYVELLQSESPENPRKLGDNLDEEL